MLQALIDVGRGLAVPEPELVRRLEIVLRQRKRNCRSEENLAQVIDGNRLGRFDGFGRDLGGVFYGERCRIVFDHFTGGTQDP